MWTRSVLARAGSKALRASRKPPRARPAIEALEDRAVPSGFDIVSQNPQDWPMYNHDAAGSRHNAAETRLRADTVGALQLKWTFPTDGPVAGTPAVVTDHVYAADATGVVYALDRDGDLLWRTTLDVGPTTHNTKVTSSLLVTNHTVVVGDLSGRIHGLNVETGAVKWTIRPNPHPYAAVWGSPTMVGKYVALGISSNEWFAPLVDPAHQLSFRGSLVLFNPADGHLLWQTFTITPEHSAAGSAGAPIWSTPTFDRATNTIFTTTGNNYSRPTTDASDSFLAIDAATGAIKWKNQRTAGDEWTLAFGDSSPQHPDFDIGDSPQVYKLGGRTVVSAGQKSGFFHVLDAATGEEVADPIQLAPPGTAGGLFADSAYAGGVVYANAVDWPGFVAGDPPNRGILSAVAADGSHELWHFDTPSSPNISGVAVAGGVVYFQSMLDGMLYALDARNGDLLARVATGGQSSGPAVSRGQVYVGTGDAAFPSVDPSLPLHPGSLVALGLPDPIKVDSIAVDDGSAQRSMVRSLTVTFSGIVTLDGGAFELRREGGGPVDLDLDASNSGGSTAAVLTFPDGLGGSLADGQFTPTVRAGRIRDALARPLDGKGSDGGNSRADVHRLFGDGDGDRDVDLHDLSQFIETLGRQSGDPQYLGYFDVNGDGRVGVIDGLAFTLRLGTRLKRPRA